MNSCGSSHLEYKKVNPSTVIMLLPNRLASCMPATDTSQRSSSFTSESSFRSAFLLLVVSEVALQMCLSPQLSTNDLMFHIATFSF